MNLFDFDFTTDPNQTNEKDLNKALKEIQQYFKKMGNPVQSDIHESSSILRPNKPVLSAKTKTLLPTLAERGYVKYDGTCLLLKDEYRDYHSPEEVANMFREAADEILANGGHYYNLLHLRTEFVLGFHGPGISEAIYEALE